MLDLFADRLGNIQINNGIVRMDFARLEGIDAEKKEAILKPAMRLVMPLDGFMVAVEQLNKIREDIIKKAQEAKNQQ